MSRCVRYPPASCRPRIFHGPSCPRLRTATALLLLQVGVLSWAAATFIVLRHGSVRFSAPSPHTNTMHRGALRPTEVCCDMPPAGTGAAARHCGILPGLGAQARRSAGQWVLLHPPHAAAPTTALTTSAAQPTQPRPGAVLRGCDRAARPADSVDGWAGRWLPDGRAGLLLRVLLPLRIHRGPARNKGPLLPHPSFPCRRRCSYLPVCRHRCFFPSISATAAPCTCGIFAQTGFQLQPTGSLPCSVCPTVQINSTGAQSVATVGRVRLDHGGRALCARTGHPTRRRCCRRGLSAAQRRCCCRRRSC